jgi:DNA-directed RNA polymerase beta subunit
VTINGSIIGYTLKTEIVDRVRLMRRKGLIDKYVNIALIKNKQEEFGEIMINMDSGRLVRPLLIVNSGKLLITNQMVDELRLGKITF